MVQSTGYMWVWVYVQYEQVSVCCCCCCCCCHSFRSFFAHLAFYLSFSPFLLSSSLFLYLMHISFCLLFIVRLVYFLIWVDPFVICAILKLCKIVESCQPTECTGFLSFLVSFSISFFLHFIRSRSFSSLNFNSSLWMLEKIREYSTDHIHICRLKYMYQKCYSDYYHYVQSKRGWKSQREISNETHDVITL